MAVIALAGTANDGLQRLRGEHFDLIVTDVGLPDVSGLEMLDRAQVEGLLSETTILVCSANTGSRPEAVARGATFLPKPVDAEQFVKLILRAGSAQRVAEEGPSTSAQRDFREEAGPGGESRLRLSHASGSHDGRVLVVDDEPLLAGTLKRLLSSEHDVVVALNGRDALERVDLDGPFDVMICDVMMPDLTGLDVYVQLLQSAPDLAACTIFITAETVRTHLIKHGIASDRITAEGFGPASPIADNASPEGRADNRRVEIVVQQSVAGAASSQGGSNR